MSNFREEACLPSLLQAQNADGGWGFHPSRESAVEPTCWVLLALGGEAERKTAEQIKRGCDWLRSAQLSDGSWPAYPGQGEGCWLTSLACLALREQDSFSEPVARGVERFCADWPGEGGLGQRLRDRLMRGKDVVRQNSALRGWSWTRGTSSWVEPTSLGLLLLRNIFPEQMPSRVAKRRQLAEAMLFDRMCPSGGWNSGNSAVYGVAGEPLVGPTAWALLALHGRAERQELQSSLEWLEHAQESTRGASSISLAHLCLRAYGCETPSPESLLRQLYATNQFLQSIPSLCFAAMALDSHMRWLPSGKNWGPGS